MKAVHVRLVLFRCTQDAITYSGIGDEEVQEHFHVDPDTGVVTIKKSLYPGTRTNYEVSTFRRQYNLQKIEAGLHVLWPARARIFSLLDIWCCTLSVTKIKHSALRERY